MAEVRGAVEGHSLPAQTQLRDEGQLVVLGPAPEAEEHLHSGRDFAEVEGFGLSSFRVHLSGGGLVSVVLAIYLQCVIDTL